MMAQNNTALLKHSKIFMTKNSINVWTSINIACAGFGRTSMDRLSSILITAFFNR
jgi:hypothetical protein